VLSEEEQDQLTQPTFSQYIDEEDLEEEEDDEEGSQDEESQSESERDEDDVAAPNEVSSLSIRPQIMRTSFQMTRKRLLG